VRNKLAEGIFFKSTEHKECFVQAMQRIKRIYDGRYDNSYGAAVYILTSDYATWSKAEGYVEHTDINIEKMLAENDWSGGYRRLVKFAGSLLGEQEVNLAEIIDILDNGNFKVMMTSILIRRHGLRVADLSLINGLSLPE
jgi:hypothetical protein